ncbi:restriction endonuclease subunit S [Bacteroides fragilis]|uniref:restriction endonuclease subunit S n=1 Tax=Bacteroides fragilis TaxID=817 RepID=UPI001C737D68|nr:restriction endonuclease subunit S [Bacteroides fragilis]MCM0296870.1 restriction endonuclease subunit S [Bacteroides fragilis]
MKLSDIAIYVDQRISSDSISINEYVTTDSLLQNKRGRTIAQNLPPMKCSLTHFLPGDILVGNIRPYLQKIWLADIEGGCSTDVLVFRAKQGHFPTFLYSVLLQDNFFVYAMKGAKGSKMPRGDKEQIMRYELPISTQEKNIGKLITDISNKIALNCQINDNLEAMAKQLYDYWFVQFDFPDENGRPYKSSGGEMVYNKRLKREIPIDWQVKNLIDFAEIKNGATPSTADEANYGGDIVWITPKDLSDQQSKFVYQGERNITKQGFDSCSTSMLPVNSVLMSSRAPIGLVSIAKHNVCTNQGFKSFIPKNMEDSIFLYYYIKHHIKQIEQLGSGTTFKEVSRDDLCKFPILIIEAKDAYKQWIELQNGIADKQLILKKEIAALTKQRDELLPLLMNGQVSVNYHLSDD